MIQSFDSQALAGREHLATAPSHASIEALQAAFGGRLRWDALLSRYTAARVGGPADVLLEARSKRELVEMVSALWRLEVPFIILGGGSNCLVCDDGIRGAVVLNRARRVRFNERSQPPTVWAESGANFGAVARQAALRGLTGLEWAGGIPGTVGGAIFGNAGAHRGDVAGNLILAEILHHSPQAQPDLLNYEIEKWPMEKLGFAYRSSVLKRQAERRAPLNPGQGVYRKGLDHPPQAVVLSALFRLEHDDPQAVQGRMDEFANYRRQTQPPGASMGSMFKNPPGDYAGRLIEAAGLKGVRIGAAEISELHANFFINLGGATASDILALISLAWEAVKERFGIELELEIEIL